MPKGRSEGKKVVKIPSFQQSLFQGFWASVCYYHGHSISNYEDWTKKRYGGKNYNVLLCFLVEVLEVLDSFS